MFSNSPCPHLPQVREPLNITHTRDHRKKCGLDYFNACLELAQSLWQSGFPAQAILQLDKSMMASSEDDSIALDYPYLAILWIIQHCPEDQFLGNPVRHFQHLASRMNHKQPNSHARVWRAWACLHLTEKHISNSAEIYPRDKQQILKEQLTIPDMNKVIKNIPTAEEQTRIATLLRDSPIT